MPDRQRFVTQRRPDVLQEAAGRDMDARAPQFLDVTADRAFVTGQRYAQVFLGQDAAPLAGFLSYPRGIRSG